MSQPTLTSIVVFGETYTLDTDYRVYASRCIAFISPSGYAYPSLGEAVSAWEGREVNVEWAGRLVWGTD